MDPLTASALMSVAAPTGQAGMTGSSAGSAAAGFSGSKVGGALGGLAGEFIADRFSAAGKAAREQNKRDIATLKSGKFGFSDAEKRSMLAGTQRALQAQTSGMEADLRRSAAAQGGFGRSGAQQSALVGLQAQRGEQLAQQAGKVDALSQQVAQQRFKDVLGRVEARREESKDFGNRLGSALMGAPAQAGVSSQKAKAGSQAQTEAKAGELLGATGAGTADEAARLGR